MDEVLELVLERGKEVIRYDAGAPSSSSPTYLWKIHWPGWRAGRPCCATR